MPGFDETEYATGDEPEGATTQPALRQSGSVGDIVSFLTEETPVEPVDDGYLTDVDRRLEVAQYYRELLRSSLFSEETPSGGIVEREVRLFIRERLEVLLAIKGAKTAPTPSQFSEEEVTVLRVLIKEVMRRDAFKPAQEKPSPPKVKQAALPEPKEVVRTVPPARPAVKPAATPPAILTLPDLKTTKKKPRKLTTPPLSLKKKVLANDGQEHEIEVHRIQRPAGALPFPANMTVATAAAAMGSVAAAAKAPTLATIANALIK